MYFSGIILLNSIKIGVITNMLLNVNDINATLTYVRKQTLIKKRISSCN